MEAEETCGCEEVREMRKEIERLRETATRAAAELRHIYRAHLLSGSPINSHDEGLIARVVEMLERAQRSGPY